MIDKEELLNNNLFYNLSVLYKHALQCEFSIKQNYGN
jgi:hypothetical protein